MANPSSLQADRRAAFIILSLSIHADSLLETAAEHDADTPAALHAKGCIARRLLSPALRGDETMSDAGAAFMRGLNRATLIPGGALILDSAAEQLEFRRVE